MDTASDKLTEEAGDDAVGADDAGVCCDGACVGARDTGEACCAGGVCGSFGLFFLFLPIFLLLALFVNR